MSVEGLRAENDQLRQRLDEAEETLRAIQTGAVDAFVVEEGDGTRVYTLVNADRPYRVFVEQMQQGAATLHHDGTVLYANLRLAELLDVPHERLIGSALRDRVGDHDAPAYDELLTRSRREPCSGELHLQGSRGDQFPVYLTFNPLPEDCGAAIGVLVTDLTAQQHQAELTAAQAALRETDRRKNEFLAILAHELRNPLAPIWNALQILRIKGPTLPDVQWASDVMDRQLNQLTRLVDDLLDVSRISQGRIELRKQRVDLSAIVGLAVETVRPLFESRGHAPVVELPRAPLFVNADPARMSQVIGNLLNNASKFTARGGRIALRVERDADEAVIRVQDSGIGIAAELQARIFDMFMQADTSVERATSGLGIGLALVKSLTEMHGGRVEVHSAGLHQGSEFVVRLPALAPTDAERPQTASDAPATTSRRILVVDDNRDSAMSLAMVLQMSGHQTQAAYDGLEAVEAAARFRPDVALLDIGLPNLNGYEAARRIRAEPWGKQVVLIALTGWGQDKDRQNSREAGFDAHMVKPVEFDALTRVLASLSPGT